MTLVTSDWWLVEARDVTVLDSRHRLAVKSVHHQQVRS